MNDSQPDLNVQSCVNESDTFIKSPDIKKYNMSEMSVGTIKLYLLRTGLIYTLGGTGT